jgi:hypothetical protein
MSGQKSVKNAKMSGQKNHVFVKMSRQKTHVAVLRAPCYTQARRARFLLFPFRECCTGEIFFAPTVIP